MRRTWWLLPLTALFALGPARAARADEPPDPFAAFDLSRPPLPGLRPDVGDAPPGPDLEEVFRREWLPGDGPRRRVQSKADGPLGSLTTRVVLTDPDVAREAPAPAEAWRAEQAWKMDVAGPLSLFGQLGAAPDAVAAEDLRVNGRTGVACKLPLPLLDVQLRGGPALSYTDSPRTERAQERSELFVELLARCPLGGWGGLEYEGSAVPGLSSAEHDRVNHDVRLALPLGRLGQLKLGAKRRWDGDAAWRSWKDGTEVYLSWGLGQ